MLERKSNSNVAKHHNVNNYDSNQRILNFLSLPLLFPSLFVFRILLLSFHFFFALLFVPFGETQCSMAFFFPLAALVSEAFENCNFLLEEPTKNLISASLLFVVSVGLQILISFLRPFAHFSSSSSIQIFCVRLQKNFNQFGLVIVAGWLLMSRLWTFNLDASRLEVFHEFLSGKSRTFPQNCPESDSKSTSLFSSRKEVFNISHLLFFFAIDQENSTANAAKNSPREEKRVAPGSMQQ